MAYYAVRKGKVPGVYVSWDEAKKQIEGFRGAKYKKFNTAKEAHAFMKDEQPELKQQTIESFFKPEGDPQESDKSLIVFTDGSCTANGRRGAKAGYAVVWPYHREYDYGSPLDPSEMQTNNRGEYTALIHALRQADELDPTKKKTLIVYTDSQLLINSVSVWMSNWKRNDWKKSDGETVANLDLLKILDAASAERSIAFRHVKAHTKAQTWQARHNDLVDKLARLQTTVSE